jgi:hypothetical protein
MKPFSRIDCALSEPLGTGTHPGGNISEMPGRNCAQVFFTGAAASREASFTENFFKSKTKSKGNYFIKISPYERCSVPKRLFIELLGLVWR